jgi:MOSC domain-containing protein YiiM
LNILGKTIGTFSAPKGYKGDVRPKTELLEMIKDHGIKDDKFAGKDVKRSVMIVGTIAYNIAKENEIDLEHGSLGENILLDFDPHSLDVGDIIQVGEVKLKLTEACSICSHLSVHDKRLPKLVAKHRGVYCEILNDGIIKKDLDICKL